MFEPESEPLFVLQIGSNRNVKVNLTDLLCFLKSSRKNLGRAIQLFRRQYFVAVNDLTKYGVTVPQVHRVEHGKAADNTIYHVVEALWKLMPWNLRDIAAYQKRMEKQQKAMDAIVMTHGFHAGVWVIDDISLFYDVVPRRQHVIVRVYNGDNEVQSFKVKLRSFGKIENSRKLVSYLEREFKVPPPLARYALHTLRNVLSEPQHL